MEQLSARLLLTAGILLLIAGGIFAILQGWLYTGLLWAGAFGCLMAALNFRDSKTTAAKAHGIVVHGQYGNASYTRFSISSDIDLALGEDRLLYAKN